MEKTLIQDQILGDTGFCWSSPREGDKDWTQKGYGEFGEPDQETSELFSTTLGNLPDLPDPERTVVLRNKNVVETVWVDSVEFQVRFRASHGEKSGHRNTGIVHIRQLGSEPNTGNRMQRIMIGGELTPWVTSCPTN